MRRFPCGGVLRLCHLRHILRRDAKAIATHARERHEPFPGVLIRAPLLSPCPSRGEWTYGIRPVRKAPGKASRTGFSEPWPPKGHSLFRGVFQMEKTVWLAAAGAFVLALLFWRAYSGTDLGLLAAFFTIVGDLLALLALAKGSDAEA